MRRLLHILPSKKGFTLIEVLIASVILVIVMGSMTMVFIEANRAWIQTEAKLQVYQNAREALNRMTRELACAYQSSSAASGLQKFKWDDSQKKLAFTAAFNITYGTNEYDLTKLGYWLDGTTLKRYKKDYGGGASGTWSPIAENITTLTFRYYDHKLAIPAWVTLWDPAATPPKDYLPKAVEITIIAQDKQGRLTKTFVDTVYIPTH